MGAGSQRALRPGGMRDELDVSKKSSAAAQWFPQPQSPQTSPPGAPSSCCSLSACLPRPRRLTQPLSLYTHTFTLTHPGDKSLVLNSIRNWTLNNGVTLDKLLALSEPWIL